MAASWILAGGHNMSIGLGNDIGMMGPDASSGFNPGADIMTSYGNPIMRADADSEYGVVPRPGIVDAEIRTK